MLYPDNLVPKVRYPPAWQFVLRGVCFISLEPVLAVKNPLTTAEVAPGGDALFTVDLTKTCSGTWYLNGKVLQESETCIINRTQTTHTLLIKNVTKKDDGAEVKFVANDVETSTKMRVRGIYWHFCPFLSQSRGDFWVLRIKTGAGGFPWSVGNTWNCYVINVCPGHDLTWQLRVSWSDQLVVSELDCFTNFCQIYIIHNHLSVDSVTKSALIHPKVVILALGLTSLFDCNNLSKVKEHSLRTKIFL